MLNTWSSRNRITLNGWNQLVSAVLEYSHQLPWKNWLREEAKALEQQDKFRCFEISHLLDEGCFTDINKQTTLDEHTLFTYCKGALKD